MLRNWHTFADGRMDARTAESVLRDMTMISSKVFPTDDGVGWEVVIDYKENQYRVTHDNCFWSVNYSTKEGLIELLSAAKSLTKRDRGLHLIISYMEQGDHGMTHMEDIRRDFSL